MMGDEREFPVDMPTRPCSFCNGVGTMREEKHYQTRMADEDEFTEHKTFIGERCPMCQGRGVPSASSSAAARL